MSTKRATRVNDLTRNQTMPMSVSKLKSAQSAGGPDDEQVGQHEAHDQRLAAMPHADRSIQTRAVRPSTRSGSTSTGMASSQGPSAASVQGQRDRRR